MPKEKRIYANLPKILHRDAVDLLLYGYVWGYRNHNEIKIFEVTEACRQFINDMGLSEDEYGLECAIQTFYRMHLTYTEFVEFNKKKR